MGSSSNESDRWSRRLFSLCSPSLIEWTFDSQIPHILTLLHATAQRGRMQILPVTFSSLAALLTCVWEVLSVPLRVYSLTQTFCQQSLLTISLSSSQCMQFTNIPPQVFAPCPLGKSWDKSIMIRLSSELFTCFSPTKSLSTCRAELMLMLMFRGLSFRDYIASVRKVSWSCSCNSL